jgi:hypothetical protein
VRRLHQGNASGSPDHPGSATEAPGLRRRHRIPRTRPFAARP